MGSEGQKLSSFHFRRRRQILLVYLGKGVDGVPAFFLSFLEKKKAGAGEFEVDWIIDKDEGLCQKASILVQRRQSRCGLRTMPSLPPCSHLPPLQWCPQNR